MTSTVPLVTLNNGLEIPAIGLGTYKVNENIFMNKQIVLLTVLGEITANPS